MCYDQNLIALYIIGNHSSLPDYVVSIDRHLGHLFLPK